MNWFLYDNGVRHERVKYIKQATKNNKTLQKLTYLILENRQFEIRKESIKPEINIDELKIFSRIKDFLAMNDTGDLILRGNRIALSSIY